MKPLSSPLIALFATRQFAIANLFEFTLFDGSVLRYTDCDIDLAWSGHAYSAGGQTGPYFGAGANKVLGKYTRGLAVSDLVFDVAPGDATVKGFPFATAINYGIFDGATLKRSKAYFPIGSIVVTGVLLMDSGRVADISLGRSLATFTVKPYTELLDLQLPKNFFQSACNHVLFDAGCGLNGTSFAVTGTIAAGSTGIKIRAQLAQASGYFDIGSISMTSGALNGLSKTIKSWVIGSPGTMNLIAPFPVAPAVGDTFTAYPGCDLTQATCSTKFANLANFAGAPFIPAPETAV